MTRLRKTLKEELEILRDEIWYKIELEDILDAIGVTEEILTNKAITRNQRLAIAINILLLEGS